MNSWIRLLTPTSFEAKNKPTPLSKYKKVRLCTKTGETIIFESILATAKFSKVHPNTVSRCCHGHQKADCFGNRYEFIWD